jgi:hypothetical protein
MLPHYEPASSKGQTIKTMAIDFRTILSYSLSKLNNYGRVLDGDRELKWNASRWNSGTVPPAVTVRTSAL